MAVGDVTLFQEFSADIGNGIYNLNSDTFKVMLVDNTNPPTAAYASPRYADWSGVNGEVTNAGSYTDTGYSLGANTSYTQTSGTATFDSTANPTWTQNGSNGTASWGIIYSDTATNDEAIGFVELGTVDMSAGALTITWNGSGIFTLG